MKMNMGSFDRIIRLLIAAVLAALFFAGAVTGTAGIVLLVIAGIFIITSFVGFCPLYVPFGFRTCKDESAA